MNTIYDKTTRDQLIIRINTLGENSKPQWGKMTVGQMVKHCAQWEEMISGKIKCKRSFIGRVFGKMALRSLIKDETPVKRNMPTSPELIVTETNGNVAAKKSQWIALVEAHAKSPRPDFIHPFFGKMTKEQVGILDYKHIDHHLRQFGS
jgi:hypothetical protein